MRTKASSKDGKEAGIELIQPPPGSKPGDRVYFEGEKYESKLRGRALFAFTEAAFTSD